MATKQFRLSSSISGLGSPFVLLWNEGTMFGKTDDIHKIELSTFSAMYGHQCHGFGLWSWLFDRSCSSCRN